MHTIVQPTSRQIKLRVGKDNKPKQADVQGIVLAGAHLWGNSILEQVVCWPLLPIANCPIISHTLKWFREGGIRSANICANSDTVALIQHLGDGESMDLLLDYYEDMMPRGPAGCVRDVIVNSDAVTFVVVEGTILPRIDIENLIRVHNSSNAILTVAATNPNKAESQPTQALEPVGIYVFSRSVVEYILATGYQDIKETLIPDLYAKGQHIATYYVDSGSALRVHGADSCLTVSRYIVKQIAGKDAAPEGYVCKGEARVHKSARVDSTVRFVGPVLIASGCVIEAGVMIVGPTSIGEGCTIGGNAIISRSAIWSNCSIGAGAILDHCILTDNSLVDSMLVIRNTVFVPTKSHRSLLNRGLGSNLRVTDKLRFSNAALGGNGANSVAYGYGPVNGMKDKSIGCPEGNQPQAIKQSIKGV